MLPLVKAEYNVACGLTILKNQMCVEVEKIPQGNP